MKIKFWHILATAFLLVLLLDRCSGDKVITKVETVERIVTDTFYSEKTVIKEIPKPVYINRTVTQKGKDSIIYVDKPNDSTITARQFNTTLESNRAKADLTIVSTGEVLDVLGTIQYPEKETIITKTKEKGGLYIYGSAPINSNAFSPELGIQYNFRNKMFIGTSAQYNNINSSLDIKLGIGVRIF